MPQLTILQNGDWNLTLDGVVYLFHWVGDMLKVTGGDICYYLLEIENVLYRSDCTLENLSILVNSL